MSTEQQWAKEFDAQLANLPGEGAILEAYGGGTARLNIELVEGKDPFIYGRAYVPSIVGQPISGWVLHEYDSKNTSGIKVILLPKARDEVIRRYGAAAGTVPVLSLRVVHKSRSGKSLLAEVAEWCPDVVEFAEPTVTAAAA